MRAAVRGSLRVRTLRLDTAWPLCLLLALALLYSSDVQGVLSDPAVNSSRCICHAVLSRRSGSGGAGRGSVHASVRRTASVPVPSHQALSGAFSDTRTRRAVWVHSTRFYYGCSSRPFSLELLTKSSYGRERTLSPSPKGRVHVVAWAATPLRDS